MFNLPVNGWDLALLAIASYVAIVALARMMLAERNRLAKELDQQIEIERARVAAEKRKADKEARLREMQEQHDRQRRKAG